MTLQQAIKFLEIRYELAKKMDYVRNPLAYALYHTWKQAEGKWGKNDR